MADKVSLVVMDTTTGQPLLMNAGSLGYFDMAAKPTRRCGGQPGVGRVLDKAMTDECYTSVHSGRWQQLDLRHKVVTCDSVDWNYDDGHFTNLHLIGGVDLSFPKNDNDHACACLVVLTFPNLEVVHVDVQMVHLTSPYVPEYLAFREVGCLMAAISRLKEEKPDVLPQVILVDGNGMLHPREFGLACHLGVLTDIPTIGVAKTLFHLDGIERNDSHQEKIQNQLEESGDSFHLVGNSEKTWGAALRSTNESRNPIYISVGHRVGLETATRLTYACCRFRVPEPTRQADILSRAFIRDRCPLMLQHCTNCEAKKKLKEIDNSNVNLDSAEKSTGALCVLL